MQLREILLRDKPADFLATSPKGTVPVLRLDNGRIDESRDIMFGRLGRMIRKLACYLATKSASSMAFLDRLDMFKQT